VHHLIAIGASGLRREQVHVVSQSYIAQASTSCAEEAPLLVCDHMSGHQYLVSLADFKKFRLTWFR
jgi:hypothetical protein